MLPTHYEKTTKQLCYNVLYYTIINYHLLGEPMLLYLYVYTTHTYMQRACVCVCYDAHAGF